MNIDVSGLDDNLNPEPELAPEVLAEQVPYPKATFVEFRFRVWPKSKKARKICARSNIRMNRADLQVAIKLFQNLLAATHG